MFYYFSVFDDEDENKLSYTEIHQQYKKLVSTNVSNMLTGRMFPNCPIFMFLPYHDLLNQFYVADSSHQTDVSCFAFCRWRSCQRITCKRLASTSSSFWTRAPLLWPSPKLCRYVKHNTVSLPVNLNGESRIGCAYTNPYVLLVPNILLLVCVY